MAVAPSSSTSIRSTAASGIVFRSTKSRKPRVPAPFTQRRPLTRTSERLAPRLRRFNEREPWLVPPEPVELKLEPTDGSSCSNSPTETTPVASISLRSMVNTGLAATSSLRRMREPTTLTVSSVFALFASPLVVSAALCASAVAGIPPAASAPAIATIIMPRRGTRRDSPLPAILFITPPETMRGDQFAGASALVSSNSRGVNICNLIEAGNASMPFWYGMRR